MNEIKRIKGISPDGKTREYDVILTFNNPKNEKDYVVYTDGTYDAEEKLRVFAAIYDPDASEPFAGYPATKEEWADICELLDKVILEENF